MTLKNSIGCVQSGGFLERKSGDQNDSEQAVSYTNSLGWGKLARGILAESQLLLSQVNTSRCHTVGTKTFASSDGTSRKLTAPYSTDLSQGASPSKGS